jgi:hypothetical protein
MKYNGMPFNATDLMGLIKYVCMFRLYTEASVRPNLKQKHVAIFTIMANTSIFLF